MPFKLHRVIVVCTPMWVAHTDMTYLVFGASCVARVRGGIVLLDSVCGARACMPAARAALGACTYA